MKRLTLLLVMLAVCGNAWAATNPLIQRVPPRTLFAGNGLPVAGSDSSAIFSARAGFGFWITAQSRDTASLLPLFIAVSVRRHQDFSYSDSTSALFPLRWSLPVAGSAASVDTMSIAQTAALNSSTTAGFGELTLRFVKHNRSYFVPVVGTFGPYPGGLTSIKARLIGASVAAESARVVISVEGLGWR
jgi:hypothetical protein